MTADFPLHCRAVESEDATETEALLSAAEQGQAGVGKFFYFSTFVQAALIVHELHLLDLASLRQVDSCPQLTLQCSDAVLTMLQQTLVAYACTHENSWCQYVGWACMTVHSHIQDVLLYVAFCMRG